MLNVVAPNEVVSHSTDCNPKDLIPSVQIPTDCNLNDLIPSDQIPTDCIPNDWIPSDQILTDCNPNAWIQTMDTKLPNPYIGDSDTDFSRLVFGCKGIESLYCKSLKNCKKVV